MIRNAHYSDLNKAVMEQDRALDELMRNHKNTCQSNNRDHIKSPLRKSAPSIRSECIKDDDMSLTLVKLRIQQEKTDRLQKQYEQEQLLLKQRRYEQEQLKLQQEHYVKSLKKDNNNVLVIDVPSDTTLIIRTIPSTQQHQKPSIMKLSASNKLVQMLKALKPHKDTSYSDLTDTTTIVGDKLSKLSIQTPSSYRSKHSSCAKLSSYDSDVTTLDDSHYSSPSSSSSTSPCNSTDSKKHKKSAYFM